MKRKGAMASGLAVVALAVLAAGGQAASAAKAQGARATGPAPHSWYSFAPYADLAGYPPPNLGAIRHAAGVRDVTLAFVTAKNGTACVPTWGGYTSYPGS